MHEYGCLVRVVSGFLDITFSVICHVCTIYEGQKVFATIFFLLTWVHLYKGGSVYIKYKSLSFMPCNLDSVARLAVLRH